MNIEESIQQIETLIEAWQLDEADLNQTDINAMQALLKENEQLKKQQEKFRKYLVNKKDELLIENNNYSNLSIEEIGRLIYCIDLIIQNFGKNKALEDLADKLIKMKGE